MSSGLTTTPLGRRRAGRAHNAEDETLSQIAKEAEARLAQKRAARIEAREIRMRELERQQKEASTTQLRKSIARNTSSASLSSWNSKPPSSGSTRKLGRSPSCCDLSSKCTKPDRRGSRVLLRSQSICSAKPRKDSRRASEAVLPTEESCSFHHHSRRLSSSSLMSFSSSTLTNGYRMNTYHDRDDDLSSVSSFESRSQAECFSRSSSPDINDVFSVYGEDYVDYGVSKWSAERRAEERVDKDREEKGTKIVGSTGRTTSYSGLSSSISLLSRSSDDSTSEPSVRELKDALAEIEEKYKQAMVQNAQLDNERTQLNYRVEQLKDSMEEQEEELYRVKREYKEKCQELEKDKRMHHALKIKHADLQEALRQRDELIQEQGLVLVGGNGVADAESDEESDSREIGRPYALVSQEAAQVLASAGDGSLDVRLKNIAEEKQDLCDQIRRLKIELEEERRNKGNNMNSNSASVYAENGVADMQLLEIQREASKQISEYKFKLQKAEQEYNTSLTNITRLESQLQRFKTTSELLEKSEDEMRVDKRKLQRDLRASLDRIEEMEMTNAHLEKRLERMRATRTVQTANQT